MSDSKIVFMIPQQNTRPFCRFQINWADNELQGLLWLQRVLLKIGDKPDHRSCQKARGVMSALHRMIKYEEKMDEFGHSAEDKIAAMEEEIRTLQRQCETLEMIVNGGEAKCKDGSCEKCRSGEPCH